MQSNSSTQSVDRLFTAKGVDAIDHARFEAGAGWRYGLAFGVAFVLVGWGVDALELANWNAALFAPKLLFALVLLVPISTAAGALAGGAFGALGRKLLIWMACGALISFIAIHIPFEGVSLFVAAIDPAVRGIDIVPFVPGVQERVAAMVILGTAIGLFVAVLQVLGTNWAWDRSTAENKMTLSGWVALMVSLPLAIVLGAVFDGVASSQLRGPFYTTQRVIQLALSTPPDMELKGLETSRLLDYLATSRWRSQFTPRYTQHLADFDPVTLTWTYIDTEFGNGFLWRCNVTRNGEILQACFDLTEMYREWMSQFLAKGNVQCEYCTIEVGSAAAGWQAQQGKATATEITVAHHSGRVVLVTASLAGGGQAECRFVGAFPAIIHDCVSK